MVKYFRTGFGVYDLNTSIWLSHSFIGAERIALTECVTELTLSFGFELFLCS